MRTVEIGVKYNFQSVENCVRGNFQRGLGAIFNDFWSIKGNF